MHAARVLVKLISLEGCPTDFALELTRAANTQNRIEKRDFAALDPQQERIKTDLLLSFGKNYVYRTGDLAPLPENGCTLDEAAVALACARSDVSLCVQAKRELSKLYDDIKQAPYTVLFNPSTSALKLWRSVEIARFVEDELKLYLVHSEGKHRLIAIHGNRFILHLVFKMLGSAILDDQNTQITDIQTEIPTITANVLDAVTTVTIESFPSAYPSNLFKNVSKCRQLANKVGARLDPASGGQ